MCVYIDIKIEQEKMHVALWKSIERKLGSDQKCLLNSLTITVCEAEMLVVIIIFQGCFKDSQT